MSKPLLPAPTASAIGPCPTMVQIVGRPGTGSLPRTIAPPDHPDETLSCGSLHKKVEGEKQFQLIHTNKEDYQLYFLEITVGLRSYIRV